MAALWNRAGHYIFAVWFLLSSSSSIYLFTSPNLSRRRLDVCHTSTHGVALVRIYDAGLKRAAHAARLNIGRKTRQKSPSEHHRTTLSACIFATSLRHVSTIGKKLVKHQYLLHISHNMVNFGPLPAEIFLRVWGTPANFNGFRVLTSLLQ